MASSSVDENIDAERRAEELDALRAFYGDDVVEEEKLQNGNGINNIICSVLWRIRVSSCAILELWIPKEYPSSRAPIPVIESPPWILPNFLKSLANMESQGLTSTLNVSLCRSRKLVT